MVDYDPHKWLATLFRVRGTMVVDISSRVLFCVLWAAAVCLLHSYVYRMTVPSTVHALGGVALSLLLVFRTNSSYDRFWEGRKLWGSIVNESRNLARTGEIFLREEPGLLRQLLLWSAAFPCALTCALRGQRGLGRSIQWLPAPDAQRVLKEEHVPLAITRELTGILDEGRRRGRYSEYVQMQLDQNIQQLVDYMGSCERIRKTPVPFAYVMHLRRALLTYCYSLPFAMVETLRWGAVVAVFLIAVLFFGIEEIGVEIEDPFGLDDNDLPLDSICETIRGNLMAFTPADAK